MLILFTFAIICFLALILGVILLLTSDGAEFLVESEDKQLFDFPTIKRMMRERQWRAASPLLLAVGGFLGVLLFGSLLLLVIMDDKLLGTGILMVSSVVVLRVVIAIIRS